MPLPWKKSKIDRVTRFVADLRSSTKRGESLVVQTGFPTSLIDLVVKNRDRLKKPSKNKKKNKNKPISSQIFHDSSPHLNMNLISKSPEENKDIGKDIFTLNDVEEEEEEEEEVVVQRNSLSNRVFFLILKIFLMLILALGTKKFTVGITFSALLLLFIEFASKHLSKPFTDAYNRLMVFIQLEKEKELIGNEKTVVVVSNSCDYEILMKEINLDLCNNDKVCEFDDEIDQKKGIILRDGGNEIVEFAKISNPRRTSSAKLKAKQLKKYVLKKFNSGSLKNRRKNEDGVVEKEKLIRTDTKEEEEKDEEDEEEIEQVDSRNVSEVSLDISFEQDLGRRTKWGSRNLIFLVIILVGLVGGRIWALLLTIALYLVINQWKLRGEIQS